VPTPRISGNRGSRDNFNRNRGRSHSTDSDVTILKSPIHNNKGNNKGNSETTVPALKSSDSNSASSMKSLLTMSPLKKNSPLKKSPPQSNISKSSKGSRFSAFSFRTLTTTADSNASSSPELSNCNTATNTGTASNSVSNSVSNSKGKESVTSVTSGGENGDSDKLPSLPDGSSQATVKSKSSTNSNNSNDSRWSDHRPRTPPLRVTFTPLKGRPSSETPGRTRSQILAGGVPNFAGIEKGLKSSFSGNIGVNAAADIKSQSESDDSNPTNNNVATITVTAPSQSDTNSPVLSDTITENQNESLQLSSALNPTSINVSLALDAVSDDGRNSGNRNVNDTVGILNSNHQDGILNSNHNGVDASGNYTPRSADVSPGSDTESPRWSKVSGRETMMPRVMSDDEEEGKEEGGNATEDSERKNGIGAGDTNSDTAADTDTTLGGGGWFAGWGAS
jgi:trimeric autotransporter adhesin